MPQQLLFLWEFLTVLEQSLCHFLLWSLGYGASPLRWSNSSQLTAKWGAYMLIPPSQGRKVIL